MPDKAISVGGSVSASAVFTSDVRTSLTGQFLMAAAMQAKAAAAIESRARADITEDDLIAHKGFVIGAIMQVCAGLECEIWELMTYGPGHHLGSGGTDTVARDILASSAEKVDRKKVTERYRIVLETLGRPAISPDGQLWQDADLVVRLRNELVHYKSRWGSEPCQPDLFAALKGKQLKRPAFMEAGSTFFPHECLSAARAAWAVRSCCSFLDEFYLNLGIPGRLDPFRERLRLAE